MLTQCIHISYYHIFPTTQCPGDHCICRGRNRGSERSSNLPKGKRKQILLFQSGVWLCSHHCLLLQRRRPRCWEVGVRGHTARWGRAGSQQTCCLPPSRPHGPLSGTRGPSPGMETPDQHAYLCAAPSSPFSLLGPQGCGRRPHLATRSGRLRGTRTRPCGAPGEQSRVLKTPARQCPGPRLRGCPVPSETIQGPRTRLRQDAPSAAGPEPGPRRPSQTPSMGPPPPPRSRVSPEQPRETPQALKLGSRLRPELSVLSVAL